ncbi:hypothetical protein [Paraburkholderia sp. RL17-337-BIB-A]|uniref:hypothetical protein n=1 Tax=Paraburkholderia sp. RL17-337-BIB-A TaxID=3031636 RepID=UPI0038B7F3AE
MAFIFDAEPFGGTADGEWNDDWRAFIGGLRARHPELAAWDNLAVGSAWGDYSQDILAVGWCDWIRERDEAFLAYIYVRLLRPSFDFGGTGLFFDDVEELASTRPWLTDDGLAQWPLN